MHENKARLLTAALRSGEFPQTKTALCRLTAEADPDRPIGFCCLGVACELALRNGVEMATEVRSGLKFYNTQSGFMPQQVMEFFDFYSRKGATRNGSQVVGHHASLASANDSDVSFADIADYIDANYEIL